MTSPELREEWNMLVGFDASSPIGIAAIVSTICGLSLHKMMAREDGEPPSLVGSSYSPSSKEASTSRERSET